MGHSDRLKRILMDKILSTEAAIRASSCFSKTIDVAVSWRSQLAVLKSRYKGFVLDGDSCYENALFALSLSAFGRKLFCDWAFGYPCLQAFGSTYHEAVLLEEIAPTCAIGIKVPCKHAASL